MAASLETSSSSVRARRRPARYSPELPQSEMSNGVLEEGQEEEVIPSAVATVVYNGHPEMAPAASNRGPGRPPSKHKKRKSSSASGANKKRSVVEDAAQKRPRVANVLLENETLIEEIKKRKALWQRTHEQHHSSVLTTPYWDEVATACDLTREYLYYFYLFCFHFEVKYTHWNVPTPPRYLGDCCFYFNSIESNALSSRWINPVVIASVNH